MVSWVLFAVLCFNRPNNVIAIVKCYVTNKHLKQYIYSVKAHIYNQTLTEKLYHPTRFKVILYSYLILKKMNERITDS